MSISSKAMRAPNQAYGETGSLRHEAAGGVGGNQVVSREDAAIGNAELNHQFLLPIVR